MFWRGIRINETSELVKKELEEILGYMISALRSQVSEDELVKFIERSRKIEYDFYVSHAVKDRLGARFLLNIYQKQDILPMVLTAHLILEAFINKIIKYNFPHAETVLKSKGGRFGFAQKVHILRAGGHIDKDLYNVILTINGLRNKYAHNLFYDIADYNLDRLYFYRGLL